MQNSNSNEIVSLKGKSRIREEYKVLEDVLVLQEIFYHYYHCEDFYFVQ